MMEYIYLKTNEEGQKIYGRIDDDGLMRITCTENDPGYQAWLNPSESGTL